MTSSWISTGINFWPVSPKSDTLQQLLYPPDPNPSAIVPGSCWTTAGIALTTESYITLQTSGIKSFPLLVNITLQDVTGCESEGRIPLVAALMKSPNFVNGIGALETAPVLSIRSCDFASAKEENGVTTCVFNCHEEVNEEFSPSGVQGYALRLKTLEALGASYGVCSITGWNDIPAHPCVYIFLH